jgi:ABC-type glycerol-3-phosphate transport system substrate-binding protein
MLASLLCACSNPSATTSDAGQSSQESVGSGEELPDIPADVKFSGEDFDILVSGTLKYSDFDVEDNDGSYETVNEAIERRNAYIVDKYEVKINTTSKYGTSFGDGPGYKAVYNDYQSSDCLYDICMVGTYDAAQLALGLLLQDLNDTPYVNLNKSWWDQKANEDLSINGVVYFQTGDISFIDNICTHMIMFNKDLIKELGLASPYEIIDADEWQYDKMLEYIRAASKDLDGNGESDQRDRYGLLTWNDVIHQALHSSRHRVATINENGYMGLTVYNATTVDLIGEYTDLFYNKDIAFNYSIRVASQDEWDTVRKSMFDNGQALFYTTLFTTVPKHRDTMTDFGIIPYPKFTETQEDYGHYISATHSQMLCIESICENLEMVGVILEDMAYMSKKLVTPAYYDDTLIGKNVRDEESIKMLDIIFSSRVFDVGIYYKIGSGSTVAANLTALLSSGQNNFASRYESFRGGAQSMIDVINEQFKTVRDR